jgi:serine/threonine protein kinase
LLSPGVVVGHHYRIVRPVGRGGMGEVYEALQEPLQRRVALKTIIPELAASQSLFTRFRREAESAAALGHPNIVQVTDFQSLPGEPPLLVMELLEGLTLKDVLERETKLEPGRAAFIAMQILSGLAAAHRAGIIHRDIKPGNVFLMSTLAVRDLVKIVDFGVAKLVEDVAVAAEAKVTAFGQVLGTLAYMAPEQAHGLPVDHRADLYAVGATLYHALSGVNPIAAMTPGSPRIPLSHIAPWVDARLASIVDRALERAPEARWASAEQMADALAPFAEGAGGMRASTLPAAGVDHQVHARLSAETRGGDDGPKRDTPIPPTTAMTPGIPMSPPMAKPPPTAPMAPPIHPAQAPGRVSYDPGVLSAPQPVSYPQYLSAPPEAPRFVPQPPPQGKSTKWIIALVVGLVVLFVVPVIVSYAVMFNSVSPSNIEARTEKGFLENAKLPACPAPEACKETHEDHGVSFPICTQKVPLSLNPLKPGEMILVKRDGKTRIAAVSEPPENGSAKVTWVTAGGDSRITQDDVVGRLCGVNAKRNHP